MNIMQLNNNIMQLKLNPCIIQVYGKDLAKTYKVNGVLIVIMFRVNDFQ